MQRNRISINLLQGMYFDTLKSHHVSSHSSETRVVTYTRLTNSEVLGLR